MKPYALYPAHTEREAPFVLNLPNARSTEPRPQALWMRLLGGIHSAARGGRAWQFAETTDETGGAAAGGNDRTLSTTSASPGLAARSERAVRAALAALPIGRS